MPVVAGPRPRPHRHQILPTYIGGAKNLCSRKYGFKPYTQNFFSLGDRGAPYQYDHNSLTTEDTDCIGLRKLKGVERIPHITDLVSNSPLFWDMPLGLWVDL